MPSGCSATTVVTGSAGLTTASTVASFTIASFTVVLVGTGPNAGAVIGGAGWVSGVVIVRAIGSVRITVWLNASNKESVGCNVGAGMATVLVGKRVSGWGVGVANTGVAVTVTVWRGAVGVVRIAALVAGANAKGVTVGDVVRSEGGDSEPQPTRVSTSRMSKAERQ